MLSFATAALSLNLSPAVSRSANPVMAWQPMRGSAQLADQALALDADTKDAIIELGLVREVRVPARAEAIDLSESVDPIEMGLVRFLRMPQRSRRIAVPPTPGVSQPSFGDLSGAQSILASPRKTKAAAEKLRQLR